MTIKEGDVLFTKIREYTQELPVAIVLGEREKGKGRLLLCSKNEGGYNQTHVDLVDVIEFVKEKMPELL